MHGIPECLRGVFMTTHYTNPRLPYHLSYLTTYLTFTLPYLTTGKVVCDSDVWMHDLQKSQSTFFDHIWSHCALDPELLTSKYNRFIFVPNCTKAVNLVKFAQAVCTILRWQIFCIWSHTHSLSLKARKHDAFSG